MPSGTGSKIQKNSRSSHSATLGLPPGFPVFDGVDANEMEELKAEEPVQQEDWKSFGSFFCKRQKQNDEDGDTKVEHIIPFREQLRKMLSSSQMLGYQASGSFKYQGAGKEKHGCTLGTVLDILNGLFNIMLTSLYISSTYSPHELALPTLSDGHWYPIFMLLTHVFFFLEFVMRIYVAEDVQKYIMTMESIVNIVTVFPYFIISFTIDSPMSKWRFFVRMLDLLRMQVLLRVTQYIENDLTRELIKIIVGAFALVLCFTGYIQWLEHMNCMFRQEVEECIMDDINDQTAFVNFFDSFFIMMTTIAIIGYISPVKTEAGKVSMIVIMAIVVAVIPNQSSKLVGLISSKSIYARRKYKSIEKVPHIVILGSVTSISLFNFLKEYLHEDHGDFNRHCVIMQPRRPEASIELTLMQPQYSSCVFYLEGNPLDPLELRRCQVETAKAVIIFSDKLSLDAHKEDTHTILQAMVIKNSMTPRDSGQDGNNIYGNRGQYEERKPRSTQVCMQLLKPESITHYELSLSKDEIKKDQIICIESMKLSLLAKSCLCPGLVALITNLIKSSQEPPDALKEKVESSKKHENWLWLYDYWSGKKYEIYRIEIPLEFSNQQFNVISKQVYKQTGFVLFALEIVVGDNINGDILLNPGSQRLPKPRNQNGIFVKYTYYGYIIAPDRDEAENIFKAPQKSTHSQKLNNALIQKSAQQYNMSENFPGLENQLIYDPLAVTSTLAINGVIDPNSQGKKMKVSEYATANIIGGISNDEIDFSNIRQLAPRQVQKTDIEFKTLKDSKLAENHIIICGMVENIKHFVMPLRAEHLLDPSPIVILHDEELTGKQWQQLTYFTQIYYVRGSPLNEESYERVNIMKAKQVVILTPSAGSKMARRNKKEGESEGNNGGNNGSDDENSGQDGEEEAGEQQTFGKNEETLLDAQTIFKYNIIKKKNPKVNVVTELISEKNLAFLLDDPLLYSIMKEYDYDQTPVFASGEVYLSSLMDSLICQAYYNPALITVLNKLIVGDSRKEDKSGTGGPGGAINQGQQALNSLLGQTNIVKDGDFSNIKTSNLYHYSVPSSFYGQKYKSLFKHLVIKRFMIPLGIYRTEKVSFRQLDPTYKDVSSDFSEESSEEDEDNPKIMLVGDKDGIGTSGVINKNQNGGENLGKKKTIIKRETNIDGADDETKKEIKYVISNPDKDVRLKENDVVFVLAQNDPKDPNIHWEDQPNKSSFFNFNQFVNQSSTKRSGPVMMSSGSNTGESAGAGNGGRRLAIIQEEEDQSDIKMNEQLQAYKHTKIELDKRLEAIVKRITKLRENTVDLNKKVNQRNGRIVQEIANQIGDMIEDVIDEDEAANRHYKKLLQEDEAQRAYDKEIEQLREIEEQQRRALEEKNKRNPMSQLFGAALRKRI